MKNSVIDVSEWQGANIDFRAVKNSGIWGVIIRAGYGRNTSQVDKYFENNYAKAKAAGLNVGCYWYSYAESVDGAAAEASACIQIIKGKKFELPVFFDIEEASASRKGKDVCTNMCIKFATLLEAQGYYVGIYANTNWFTNYLHLNTLYSKYSLWCAQYANACTLPVSHGIWQYSSTGTVAGVSGNCDMNWCYRDYPSEIVSGGYNGYNGAGSSSSGPVVNPLTGSTVISDSTIVSIQNSMNSRYGTGLSADGIYGPKTKSAFIKGLQTELNKQINAGLVVDGLWGPKTKAACCTVKVGATGNITYILQAALYCNGYNTNGIDGIFGSGTLNAVINFQKNNDLSADGIAGPDTFAKLLS